MKYFILVIYFLFCQECHSNKLFEVTAIKLNTMLDSNFVKLRDLGFPNKNCVSLIKEVKSWVAILTKDPIFFENPFANFKAVKTLSMDIPRACKSSRQSKLRTFPTKKDVQASINMILQIIDLYNIENQKVFYSIPNISASDCFVFCSIALDNEEEKSDKEKTFAVAKRFYEHAKSLMKMSDEEDYQRNKKIMRKTENELKDAENMIQFQSLCKRSKGRIAMLLYFL